MWKAKKKNHQREIVSSMEKLGEMTEGPKKGFSQLGEMRSYKTHFLDCLW